MSTHLVVKNGIQLFDDCVQFAVLNASTTDSGIRPLLETWWPFLLAHSLIALDCSLSILALGLPPVFPVRRLPETLVA
ncbi:hypothetical protein BKG59_05675 [Mycobacteroides chelonae]|nr:hypothetical protein BKG63_24035 [Mycobacteroides chelonae]OHT99547.1 hypothetical protein BKG72_03705 [Mycobacteroides chelonae]OLT92920.1 hypothetical protein BKG59_05675 [Mycobacteroides chelonae]